jgi:hypothetical protein
MNELWPSLEDMPGIIALLPVWRDLTGDGFLLYHALCFMMSTRTAISFPCQKITACAYRIIRQPDGSIVGICRSNPAICQPIKLSEEDVTVLELNWKKLGRAICQAFGFESKFAELKIHNTVQIGTWSADAVPVILCIQMNAADFRHAVAEVTATLNKRFMLFAPTSRNVDVPCLQLLAHSGSEFFPLDTTVRISPNGTLHSIRTPGELFAKFTPQPKELEKSVAERAFALVKQFDPKTLQVFQLYCIEELSATQVAQRLACSKTSVLRRLNAIKTKTGIHPKHFRRLSDHLTA